MNKPLSKNLIRIIALILCLAALTGCSGGSLYSNYRELEQLTVIQTMGFDSLGGGRVMLSVSSGEGLSGSDPSGPGVSCLFAEADSITLAREKMQDMSASEQLFFAHTAYAAIGSDTAAEGIMPYLDYIARISDLRLDVPLFVVEGSSARELICGAGGSDHDATSVFRSVERSCGLRGDCIVFSAAEILPAIYKNGCALLTAVRTENAADAVTGAKPGELTAVPDGLVIIKGGRAVGRISAEDSLGVSLLLGRAGPAAVELTAGDGRATAQLDKCSCEISPVIENGRVEAFYVKLTVSAALSEISGAPDKRSIEKALEDSLTAKMRSVLSLSKRLDCDFLQLQTMFARQKPFALAGSGRGSFDMRDIYYNVETSASLDRSFDIELMH